MKTIVLKNILIHLFLLPFYWLTFQEISQIPDDRLETLLLFIGLMVIAPITSNFIYSYEKALDTKSLIWGHITTAISMTVIGILLIMLDILLLEMIGNIFVFRISLILFWIAVISFDFADWSLTISHKKK